MWRRNPDTPLTGNRRRTTQTTSQDNAKDGTAVTDLTLTALTTWLADTPGLDTLAAQGRWQWFPRRAGDGDYTIKGFSGTRRWPDTTVVDLIAARGPDDATAQRSHNGDDTPWTVRGTLADVVTALRELGEPEPQ